jgi:hypothetical protein
VIFNERKELLAYIAKRFREEVPKHDELLRLPTPTLGIFQRCFFFIELKFYLSIDDYTQAPSLPSFYKQRSISRISPLKTEKTSDSNLATTGELRYCVTCGRSTGVRLTPCTRCQKVFFCSKVCKINGWNTFHRYECRQMTSSSERLCKKLSKDKLIKIILAFFVIVITAKSITSKNTVYFIL